MAKELWKDVVGHPYYRVSDQGRVYSKRSKKIMRPCMQSEGSLQVTFCNHKVRTRMSLSHVVAQAFGKFKPDYGKVVVYHDRDRSNCKLSNLDVIPKEEVSQYYGTEKAAPVSENLRRKIHERHARGEPLNEIARHYELSPAQVGRLVRSAN